MYKNIYILIAISYINIDEYIHTLKYMQKDVTLPGPVILIVEFNSDLRSFIMKKRRGRGGNIMNMQMRALYYIVNGGR